MSDADQLHRRPQQVGFWAVLLLSIFAWAPTTYPGYWQALEGFIPVFNVLHAGPLATVATTADLWRGTGGGALMLAQPFLVLGASPTLAVRIVFALCLILGSLGVYSWLRPRYGDRAAALAALVYLFFPAILATVYVRGSLQDAVVAALLPLTLAALSDYVSGRSPASAALAVLALIWIWRSQAGLAVFVSALLLGYVLWVERDRIGGLVVLAATAAAAASLIPLGSIRAAPPVSFHEHYVYLHQFLGNQWRVAPSIPGWQDGYPFQLGLAAILLMILAAWTRWGQAIRSRADGANDRLLRYAFSAFLLLLLLSTAVSRPLWALTGAETLLTYPWQLLTLTAPLVAAISGALLLHRPRLQQMPYWLILLLMIVLSSAQYTTSRFTQILPPNRPLSVIGADANIALLAADLRTVDDESAAELTVTWQVLAPLERDFNVFLQAVTPSDAGTEVIAQLDTQPLPDNYPATIWQPGEILDATYRLELPADSTFDPRAVRYLYGLYDWRDGSRLPVDGGIDDKLVLFAR